MNVKELIENLKQMPLEAPVIILKTGQWHTQYYEIKSVELTKNQKVKI